MKRDYKLYIICLAIFIVCFVLYFAYLRYSNYEENKNEEKVYIYDGKLGSAGEIDKTTIIVSIFASDKNNIWTYNDEENSTIYDTLDDLEIATDYLTKQVKKYKKNAKFIFDWANNSDLRYDTSFDEVLVRSDGSMYDVQKQYIENNINSEELKKKYKADNIIYMFFFNTDYSNQSNSWTLGYSNSKKYDKEYTNVFIKYDDKFIMAPSSYAHEIMHCFGAHDLYYANSYIPIEYVNYCKEVNCKDIMYRVTADKEIHFDFTELDAYYLGLIDYVPKIVNEYNLALTEH
ncbi:MAG: hypothetical protein IKR57_00860 [Bacilli bacterium]|nr:hypothetical protein [Bacilli bacterium]